MSTPDAPETAPSSFQDLILELELALAPMLGLAGDHQGAALSQLGSELDVRALREATDRARRRYEPLVTRGHAPPLSQLRELLRRVSLDGRVLHLVVTSGNKPMYLLLESLREWIDALELRHEIFLHEQAHGPSSCRCAIARRTGRFHPSPDDLSLISQEASEREGISLHNYRCPHCGAAWQYRFFEDGLTQIMSKGVPETKADPELHKGPEDRDAPRTLAMPSTMVEPPSSAATKTGAETRRDPDG